MSKEFINIIIGTGVVFVKLVEFNWGLAHISTFQITTHNNEIYHSSVFPSITFNLVRIMENIIVGHLSLSAICCTIGISSIILALIEGL